MGELVQQDPVGQHVLLDQPGRLVTGQVTGIEDVQTTGAFGRRITLPHLTLDTPTGGSVQVPASGSGAGYATVLDAPLTLSELQLAPVPEATAHTPEITTVPSGTTVTGEVPVHRTSHSPTPTPAPTPETTAAVASAGVQVDPAVAYQLHNGPTVAITSRGLT